MRCRPIQQTDACVQVSLMSLCFVCSLCLCPFVLPLFRFYLLYFGILLSFFHFAFPQPVCVSLSYVSVCLSACLPLICSILSVEFTAWVLSVSLCLVACLSLWLSGCLATFYVSQFVITHNTTNWFYISVCVFLHLSLCVCVCHACALCVWVSVCVCVCVCPCIYPPVAIHWSDFETAARYNLTVYYIYFVRLLDFAALVSFCPPIITSPLHEEGLPKSVEAKIHVQHNMKCLLMNERRTHMGRNSCLDPEIYPRGSPIYNQP